MVTPEKHKRNHQKYTGEVSPENQMLYAECKVKRKKHHSKNDSYARNAEEPQNKENRNKAKHKKKDNLDQNIKGDNAYKKIKKDRHKSEESTTEAALHSTAEKDTFEQSTVEKLPHKRKKKRDVGDTVTAEVIPHKRRKEREKCVEPVTEKVPHKKKKRKHNLDIQVSKGITKGLSQTKGTNYQNVNEEETESTNGISKNPDHNLDKVDTTGFSSDEIEEDDQYDFVEEELDFIPPLLHFKGYCVTLTAAQKFQVREEGVPVKYGKWLEEEDEILKRNWDNFAKKYGLKKPHLLLGLQVKRNPCIVKFIHAKKFYYHLGKDLNNRPLHSVYLRARKLFNPYNDSKDTTPDLLEEIARLQSIHGNKWTEIGNRLERSGHSIGEIARWHRKQKALGSWTEEEDEELINAIMKVLQIKDISNVYQGIPWEQVAELIPSRNAKQCRAHWLLNLCWKVNNPNKTRVKWNDVHTVRLVNYIYNVSVENEEELDWIEIFNMFPNVHSYSSLHSKWGEIKRKVPGYEEKDFEDIVTYLYKVYLPVIIEKLGEKSIKEVLDVS